MKQLTSLISAVMIFAAVTFSGCIHAAADSAAAAPPPAAASSKYQKISAEILSAFQNEDYSQLEKLLPESLAKDFSENVFKQSCRQLQQSLGKMTQFTFVTELEAPIFKTLVYKAQFERKSRDGKTIKQEALFKAMFSEQNRKTLVLSFGFL